VRSRDLFDCAKDLFAEARSTASWPVLKANLPQPPAGGLFLANQQDKRSSSNQQGNHNTDDERDSRMPTRFDLFRSSAFLRCSDAQPEEKFVHRAIPRDEILAFQDVCQTCRLLAKPVLGRTVKEERLPPFIWSISAGCPHLPRRLSGPAPACMRECAHLSKAQHPRNLGHM